MVNEKHAEKATALLFTSMTCPHCPKAKEIFGDMSAERSDVEFHDLMTHDKYAQRLAKKFNVQSVPTFIIYGPGNPSPMGLAGVQSKDTLNKYFDIATGKQAHEAPKPLFSGIKKLFGKA